MPGIDYSLLSGLGNSYNQGMLQAQQRQAQEAQMKQQAADQALKRADFLMNLLSNDNIPDSMKPGYYNELTKLGNMAGVKLSPLPGGAWESTGNKVAKRMREILKNPEFDYKLKGEAISALSQELSPKQIQQAKPFFDTAEKQIKSEAALAGNNIESQMLETPGLKSSPEAYNYALGQRNEALIASGADAKDLRMPKPESDTGMNALKEFEAINGIDPSLRGTPQYKAAYEQWLGKKNQLSSSGITNRSNEDKYLRVISLADNDDTVKQFKRTQNVSPYIGNALKIFKETGNAGILQDALIYSHNKILDADSVVMVSEYLRAKGQQSLVDSVKGNVYKLFDGSAGLSMDQQKVLLEAVQNALDKKADAYDQRIKAFRRNASRYNSNADEINETFPLSGEIFGAGDSSKGASSAAQPTPQRRSTDRGASGRQLDPNTAKQYLERAGGDKNKAREMARKDGYSF